LLALSAAPVKYPTKKRRMRIIKGNVYDGYSMQCVFCD
jgi:hypothetical protein